MPEPKQPQHADDVQRPGVPSQVMLPRHPQPVEGCKSRLKQVIKEVVGRAPLGNKTLTVYIANDYQDCENNIIG